MNSIIVALIGLAGTVLLAALAALAKRAQVAIASWLANIDDDNTRSHVAEVVEAVEQYAVATAKRGITIAASDKLKLADEWLMARGLDVDRAAIEAAVGRLTTTQQLVSLKDLLAASRQVEAIDAGAPSEQTAQAGEAQ